MASTMPFSVAGKTAIITGAGSGINLAFAELLLSRNCNVVFADLELRPEAENVVSKYQSEDGGRAAYVRTDVTSWSDLSKMFDFALETFGDFDIVCPGAGVYEPNWSNFWHPPGSSQSRDAVDKDHYALLDINLTHPIRATQMAISHWLYPRPPAEGSKFDKAPPKVSLDNPKRVIHITSVAAQVPTFRAPLYGASKFGLQGFIRCLTQLEPRIGVRINGVAPGIVRTPLWTEHPEKLMNVNDAQDAWVTPQEVAQAMLQCVEDNENIGGTILEVGAGNTRRVKVFNDEGPDRDPAKGLITSNNDLGDGEVVEWLQQGAIWGPQA
ncbi:NAD(P)-binding protein [Trichoderma citrinoviride]|uniref:NAD(P)-binding protein n=1 Tax=Trichoderma citrinoviride TaxID=58853 RepID=A0A2T4BLZ7_9HYPO|nr:NAD(P)-binding protein [Trichoderma citrinoviride]PTB70289.1 NAD(P)-binding protein [Trichoderma citrinoviride]